MRRTPIALGLVLSLALAACGQQTTTPMGAPPTASDVPPASGSAQDILGTTRAVELVATFAGYVNAQGQPISQAEALALNKKAGVVTPQNDNIPYNLACQASTSVRAYSFSPNVYGRIQIDCAEVGGKFDRIDYATVRITDPGGSYADGYQVSGVGSQHAEVLGGPVNKINGRYVVQGTLQAAYSKPISQYTRQVYNLETRPLEATYATW